MKNAIYSMKKTSSALGSVKAFETLKTTLKSAKKSLFMPVFGLILAFTAAFALGAPSQALAAIPTLSITSAGTNAVQLTVNGDQNQPVNLYYYGVGSSAVYSVGSIGSTNQSGYFSTTLNSGSYGIPSGASVYVIVNNQQSSNATWPATAGGNVTLNQSNVTLNQGQTTTVGISGGTGNNYYVSTNTNSGAIGASVSGSVLTLSGTSYGYGVITVCSLSSNTGCASVSVNVNNYGNNGNYNGAYGGPIYLTPNSVTVAPGQTQSVSISGGNPNYQSGYYYGQNYYIANNPGTQYFSASISGNILTIYGNNVGSGTVNVCTYSNTSNCASVYVTVSGSYYNGNNYNGYNGYGGTYYNYNNCSGYPYYYSYGCNYNNYNYGTYGNYGNGSGFTMTNTYGSNYYSGYPNNGFSYSYSYPSNYSSTYYPSTYTYPSTYSPATTYTYSGTSNANLGRSVSGVFLSQLPSTGISFGFKMTLFAIGLSLWSMFAAYMIARKKNAGVAAVGASMDSISGKIAAFKNTNLKKKGIL